MSRASDQAPRVLVLASIFPAVSETFVVDHVAGLVRRGFQVTLLALEGSVEAKEEIEKRAGIRFDFEILDPPSPQGRIRRVITLLKTLGWRRIRSLRSVWERDLALRAQPLMRRIAAIRPDVIHAHFGPNALMASLAASPMRIPLIADFHGYDVTVIPERHGWHPYARWLSGARAVAHSTFVEERVNRHIGCPVSRVHLGVDATVFAAPPRADAWSKRVSFLCVGRAVYQKGFHIPIAMLALFQRHFPDFSPQLTICGDGPQMAFLQRCVALYGVEDRVAFTGALAYEGVAEQMARADILLIPSLHVASGWEEAFCRVAIEGMAMGLSVVASATGGLKETVGSGGRSCRAGSAVALLEAVGELLMRSNPRAEAHHARERARQFTIERMDEEYAVVTDQAMVR